VTLGARLCGLVIKKDKKKALDTSWWDIRTGPCKQRVKDYLRTKLIKIHHVTNFLQWIYTLYSGFTFYFLLMLVFGLFILFPLLISDRGQKISFVFIRLWAGISGGTFWNSIWGPGKEHIDSSTSLYLHFQIIAHLSIAPMIPLCVPQVMCGQSGKKNFQNPSLRTIVGKLAVWVDAWRYELQSRTQG